MSVLGSQVFGQASMESCVVYVTFSNSAEATSILSGGGSKVGSWDLALLKLLLTLLSPTNCTFGHTWDKNSAP